MKNKNKPINEGYQPTTISIKKGYQPNSNGNFGYQPTTNTSNPPKPPQSGSNAVKSK